MIVMPIVAATMSGQPLDFSITNQTGKTVTLFLNADPSTVKGYAIGLTPNLSDSTGILPYISEVTYQLPDANAHIIYLKYYSITGNWSPVISHSTEGTTASTSTITNTVTTTPTSLPIIFSRTLKRGSKGNDVLALQQFLNTHGFMLSASGAGTPGNETTFYGPATASAVTKFQNANAAAILKPNGLTSGTGIFGPATLKFVNSILQGSSK